LFLEKTLLNTPNRRTCLHFIALACALPGAARAQKKYDTGASDTEIKIGNFVPYSGPASAYGSLGKVYNAYFEKINAEGGIHGRKITFLSLDDAYNPAQSVEQTRKLVERDGVLLLFGAVGTAHNQAIVRYMNQRKVPHLFISSGATRWGEYQKYPWSMGWAPSYEMESRFMVRHILKHHPQPKIGVLMQNDDFGKDSFKGVLDELGDKADQLIVSRQTYEITDPTIDNQIISLKNAGANVLINFSLSKAAVQSIRKVAEIGWKPTHYISSVSASIQSVFVPAGVENALGVITPRYVIDPADPQFKDSAQVREYLQFMRQYYPDGDPNDLISTSGYGRAVTMVKLLQQCGDDLTRANIMKQAANMDFDIPMLLPGLKIKTSPTDHYPLEDVWLMRFDGTRFVLAD